MRCKVGNLFSGPYTVTKIAAYIYYYYEYFRTRRMPFETHTALVMGPVHNRGAIRAARRGCYGQGSHNCIANDLWVVGSMYPGYPYIFTYRKETTAFETSATAVITYDLPRQCGEPVKKAVPPNHTP